MAGFKIENELGATVFSILSGLSALFFTAWVFSPGGCTGPKEPVIEPVPTSEAQIGELKQQLASTEGNLLEESARRSELAVELREANAKLAEVISAQNEIPERMGVLLKQIEADKAAFAKRENSLQQKLAASSPAKMEALEGELAKVQSQLKSEREACREAKVGLAAEIETLQQKLDQALYGEQLKAAGDFPALDLPFLVSDPIELHHKVRPLFIGLRGVKEEEAKLDEVYAKLSEGGSTSAIHKVPFDSGSAEVAAAETTKLRELLKDTPKGAKFLVVGYASPDGDAKSNHELSSKRASNVAAKLTEIEGVTAESVQAVYFGQTKRFSVADMAPNRVVEVWRVK